MRNILSEFMENYQSPKLTVRISCSTDKNVKNSHFCILVLFRFNKEKSHLALMIELDVIARKAVQGNCSNYEDEFYFQHTQHNYVNTILYYISSVR
jgi:hypothetical protein